MIIIQETEAQKEWLEYRKVLWSLSEAQGTDFIAWALYLPVSVGIIWPPKGDFENSQVLSCLSVKEAKLLLAFSSSNAQESFPE